MESTSTVHKRVVNRDRLSFSIVTGKRPEIIQHRSTMFRRPNNSESSYFMSINQGDYFSITITDKKESNQVYELRVDGALIHKCTNSCPHFRTDRFHALYTIPVACRSSYSPNRVARVGALSGYRGRTKPLHFKKDKIMIDITAFEMRENEFIKIESVEIECMDKYSFLESMIQIRAQRSNFSNYEIRYLESDEGMGEKAVKMFNDNENYWNDVKLVEDEIERARTVVPGLEEYRALDTLMLDLESESLELDSLIMDLEDDAPLQSNIKDWSEKEVGRFIERIDSGLAIYKDNFVINHIEGSVLLELDSETLVSLGVDDVTHRSKILEAIKDLAQKSTL